LFALLRSEKHEEWAAGALHSLFPRLTREELVKLRKDGKDDFAFRMQRVLELPLNKSFPLPRQVETGFVRNYKPEMEDNYPMLVRFEDLTKPETVKRVDSDKLDASFGSGVVLRSIKIIRTTAPMNSDIASVLPWLARLSGYRTDPKNPFTNTLPSEIGYLLRK
jgi:hypothetical protein